MCVNVTLELSIYMCVCVWVNLTSDIKMYRNNKKHFTIIRNYCSEEEKEKYIHRDRYNIFIRLFLSGKKECICQISVSVTIANNTINCRHFFDISLMNCLFFFFVRHTACQHIRKERKYPSRISITPWGFVCALASITSCRHP